MLIFKIILKLIIRGFKDAWDFYIFITGTRKLPVDFKDEDFEPYYPDEQNATPNDMLRWHSNTDCKKQRGLNAKRNT